jgi:hypothetical protein
MSKSLRTSNDQLMLDYIAGDSGGDQLGPHAGYGGPNTGEHTRDFSGPLVANCLPSLALPLRPASKIHELQPMDPTFAKEFVTPKAILFQCDGAGDGNRTHDIQLGKLSFYH